MGHVRLLVTGIVVVLAACKPPYAGGGGDDDGHSPDAPGTDSTPIRTCACTFSYRPDAGAIAVEVAGECDWSTRTPLTDVDLDGTYTAELELAPGLWAYKLVVTRDGGATEWLLDPSNPYRTYA